MVLSTQPPGGAQPSDPVPARLPDGSADSQRVGPQGLYRAVGGTAGEVTQHASIQSRLSHLLTHNIVDHHTYAYRGFYVDTWRGIDFSLSRPEVDPTRIGVTGTSQGGGLTICTAAMRPEPPRQRVPLPLWLLDAIELTHTYPYEEINDYLRQHPDSRPEVEETLAYFDGLNFADRITCPIIVNIGLQDNVCPPETGYALFNRIVPSTNACIRMAMATMPGEAQHSAIMDRFFAQHLSPER